MNDCERNLHWSSRFVAISALSCFLGLPIISFCMTACFTDSVTGVGVYECKCTSGFAGKNCEKATPPFSPAAVFKPAVKAAEANDCDITPCLDDDLFPVTLFQASSLGTVVNSPLSYLFVSLFCLFPPLTLCLSFSVLCFRCWPLWVQVHQRFLWQELRDQSCCLHWAYGSRECLWRVNVVCCQLFLSRVSFTNCLIIRVWWAFFCAPLFCSVFVFVHILIFCLTLSILSWQHFPLPFRFVRDLLPFIQLKLHGKGQVELRRRPVIESFDVLEKSREKNGHPDRMWESCERNINNESIRENEEIAKKRGITWTLDGASTGTKENEESEKRDVARKQKKRQEDWVSMKESKPHKPTVRAR